MSRWTEQSANLLQPLRHLLLTEARPARPQESMQSTCQSAGAATNRPSCVQVLHGIPASALAGAMLEAGPAQDPGTGLLLQLDALRSWAGTVAARDLDPQCCMLAQVCPAGCCWKDARIRTWPMVAGVVPCLCCRHCCAQGQAGAVIAMTAQLP